MSDAQERSKAEQYEAAMGMSDVAASTAPSPWQLRDDALKSCEEQLSAAFRHMEQARACVEAAGRAISTFSNVDTHHAAVLLTETGTTHLLYNIRRIVSALVGMDKPVPMPQSIGGNYI